MTIQDVLAAASHLSQEERLQVAIRLLESLSESYSALQQKNELDSSLVQSLTGVIPVNDEDAKTSYIDYLEKKYSLHDLFSKSPLSRLDFEAESIKSPVRTIEF